MKYLQIKFCPHQYWWLELEITDKILSTPILVWTEFYLQIFHHFFIFLKFYHYNICHFDLAKPNWWAFKLGETAVLGMQLVFFCSAFCMVSVNFDVCSIDFVMLLLNGVPFSIFVLIRDYCTHLAWMDFLMPQLCCPVSFKINMLLLNSVL